MATQQIPNLVQGVSQQAVQQRRDTQCAVQFDCVNSVLEGAIARPPFEYVGRLSTLTDLAEAFFYELSRGDENYLVGVGLAETPFAINLTTALECSVTWGSPDAYLDTATGFYFPKDQFRAQAIQDVVFLINRAVAPAMATSPVSSSRNPEALLNCKAGTYSTYLKLKLVSGANVINAVVLTHPSDYSGASTTYIADNFALAINTTYAAAGFTAVNLGSVLHIYRADNADFTINCDDGNGGEFMIAIKEKVSDFSKLPAKAVNGFILAVSGQNRAAEDDYYVKFVGEPSTGAWQETVAEGLKTTLNPATMPHAFTLTGLNTFTFGTKSWSTRIAGDETTSPDPGFIGEKPRDIFYHQQRLGLLHDGGAVWSKSRFPFTYFADTVQTILAEAPIDVSLIAGQQGRGTSECDFAVQFDEVLSFWATKAQFRVSWAQDGFRQETVDVPVSTAFEYSRVCDPLGLGSFLYFASDAGPHSTMRSIMSQGGKARGEVFITGHVPKYLKNGIRWLCGIETMGLLFGVSQNDPGVIYVYNYLYQGDEYVQSAWNKWRLPGGNILWMGTRGNVLRVLHQRPNGVYLFKCDLTPGAVDEGGSSVEYLTRLDYRLKESQVTSMSYNAGTNRTTLTIPWNNVGDRDVRVVVRSDPVLPLTRPRGYEFPVVGGGGAPPGRTVEVTGDCTGYQFYVGCEIRAEREESRFAVRGERGVLPVDRLTIDRFTVELSNTGYTRIEVAVPNKDTRSYVYTGRTVGLPGSLLGTPQLGTDDLTAPVGELAEHSTITLINDSFLPSAWQSASYEYTAVGKAALGKR